MIGCDECDDWYHWVCVGIQQEPAGNQIWICPQCGKPDDGSPMIGCDECDDWYHWVCVGIQQEPAENQDWMCPRCALPKQKQQNILANPKSISGQSSSKSSKRGRPSKLN